MVVKWLLVIHCIFQLTLIGVLIILMFRIFIIQTEFQNISISTNLKKKKKKG